MLNPSDHSDECCLNGGVWNLMYPEQDNSLVTLRVRWGK